MDKELKTFDPAAMEEVKKKAAQYHEKGEKIPKELLDYVAGGDKLTNWKCPDCGRSLWFEYCGGWGYFHCECGYYFEM